MKAVYASTLAIALFGALTLINQLREDPAAQETSEINAAIVLVSASVDD
ncbi:hypothetical protein [Rhodoferax sp. GW822-FHT02A01]